MSDRGHGRFGLRVVRPFSEYQRESARRKDTYIRMQSAQVLNSVWFNNGNGTYSHTYDEEFDGRTLDVVGVRLIDEVLERVDTGAECIAEASTYRYSRVPGGLLQLTVHLAGGASPSGRNVLLVSAWHDTTGAARREHLVHPELGRERLVNGELDTWAGSPAFPSSWTLIESGGAGTWSVTQIPGLGDGTTYAARFTSTGGANNGRLRQTVSLAAGAFDVGALGYRSWGSYRTPRNMAASGGVRIKWSDLGSPEQAVAEDGRSIDTAFTDGLDLPKTNGKLRLWLFDFLVPGSSAAQTMALDLIAYVTSGTVVSADFGRASIRKIHGWNWHAPRVSPGGLPDFYEGSSDPFPGSESTGAGTIVLANDGAATMERRFSYPWLWPSREVDVLLGGAFQGGQEILHFDMKPAFRGVIHGDNSPRVSARRASVAVEDYRQILEAVLPPRFYGVDFPNVEPAFRNRPRPLVFGLRPHTNPAGVDFTGGFFPTGYRTYELCDTTDWAAGIRGVPTGGGWAYPDVESADAERTDVRVQLVEGLHYSQNAAAGTVDILHDVRVFEVTAENNKCELDDGSFNYVVTIPPGWYTIGNGPSGGGPDSHGVLGLLQAGFASQGISGSQFLYDEATHMCTIGTTGKITVNFHRTTSDGGTIDGFSILPLLGFDAEDVMTGSAQYTGSIPLFESSDAHIVRFDVEGFVDPTGRFTGLVTSPASLIVLLGDVWRFILEILLAQPTARYHLAEFVASRLSCPQILGLYLGGLGDQPSTLRVSEILDRLEAGSPTTGEGPAEIRLDGEGRFRFLKRVSTVPDDVPHLLEHDLVELIEGSYMPSQAARFVEVRFDRDASTGKPRAVRTDNEFTRLAFQNDRAAIYETFLTDEADATAANVALVALHRAPIRQFVIVAKAKVLGTMKGDQIRVTCSQALFGASGGPALVGEVLRVRSRKLQPETQRVVLDAFTDIIE